MLSFFYLRWVITSSGIVKLNTNYFFYFFKLRNKNLGRDFVAKMTH